jgi:hypothetical protein
MSRNLAVSNDMGHQRASELRIIAISIWHYQHMGAQEARLAADLTEAERVQRIERFRTELHRIVGERDDIILKTNGGCIEAEIEDLRFVSFEIPAPNTKESVTLVTLLGRCPACGEETASEPVFNLAGLGRILEKFEPGRWHYCCIRLQR